MIFRNTTQGRNARSEPLLVAGMSRFVTKTKRYCHVLLITRWSLDASLMGRHKAHEFVEAGIEPIRSFTAAAVAFDPAWGDVDGNITRIVAGIENVARQGVRLAVLPELATTGYIFDNFAMVKPYLDTVHGKATA